MICYLDSSVLLRLVLGQPGALSEWDEIDRGVASRLVEVECLRTLDRLRLAESLDDREIAIRRETIYRLLDAMEVVELTQPVLGRASQPMPTALGALDAIHLDGPALGGTRGFACCDGDSRPGSRHSFQSERAPCDRVREPGWKVVISGGDSPRIAGKDLGGGRTRARFGTHPDLDFGFRDPPAGDHPLTAAGRSIRKGASTSGQRALA
ncbi:MAG: PIN domain-containing protein [Thermoanaerobaculales bacterium]